jgi:hypothetical protein
MAELQILIGTGMQSKSEIGFQMAVKAEGPMPIIGVSIAVNDKPIEGVMINNLQILDPARNLTSLGFSKSPGAVIKAGDDVKITIVDILANTVSKTGTAQVGFSAWMPAKIAIW